MNKYLKSASDSFEKIKQKDYLINPISILDCEIMTEIVELFKRGGYDDVVQVLKSYKYLKDEEIRDQLIECNLDFNEEEFEEFDDIIGDTLEKRVKKLKEKFDDKIEFITLGSDRINSNLIFGFRADEQYDLEDRFTGSLILNPTNVSATKIPLYANHILTFYDESEFEENVNLLERQLEKANIKFINKDIAKKENNKKDDSGISDRESDFDEND